MMSSDREILSQKLISCKSFWSFKIPQEIPDDILIEKTLIYLDLVDINLLFKLFSSKKIKHIWRSRVVIQDDYYHTLNKLLAWMYFEIKNPDRYIKTTISNHINHLS